MPQIERVRDIDADEPSFGKISKVLSDNEEDGYSAKALDVSSLRAGCSVPITV